MYMAPRTPSPITMDFICEAPPPRIKQTTAIAVRARSMKRFTGGSSSFRILWPVNNADGGLTALKPDRPSLRQQFQVFIRDLFVRHPRSAKKLGSDGRF